MPRTRRTSISFPANSSIKRDAARAARVLKKELGITLTSWEAIEHVLAEYRRQKAVPRVKKSR